MYQRINYEKVAPDAVKALSAVGTYLATCGLEQSLKTLVRLRLSSMHRIERLDFATAYDYNYDHGIKINCGIETQEKQG